MRACPSCALAGRRRARPRRGRFEKARGRAALDELSLVGMLGRLAQVRGPALPRPRRKLHSVLTGTLCLQVLTVTVCLQVHAARAA